MREPWPISKAPPEELVPHRGSRMHGDGRHHHAVQEAPGDRTYEVRASGHQEDATPNHFTRIDIVHVVEGPAIDVEAVRRAIELSATKFCSVGATLSSGLTEIHHAYIVRDGQGDDRMAEVLVTGPNQEPHAPLPEPEHGHPTHAATAPTTTMIVPREP